jgi:hypothetical protein
MHQGHFFLAKGCELSVPSLNGSQSKGINKLPGYDRCVADDGARDEKFYRLEGSTGTLSPVLLFQLGAPFLP